MADNPFSGSSGGGGGPSPDNPFASGGSVSTAKKSGGGGGLGGFLHDASRYSGLELEKNLLSDAYSSVTSLPTGAVAIGGATAADIGDMIHHRRGAGHQRLLDLIKQLGEGYKAYYGHDVLHHLYTHPLQPALDALTVYDLGVGGAAKAGEIANVPKLAALRERGVTTTRSPRQVYQGEGPTITELGSTKPSRNLRAKAGQKITAAQPTGRVGGPLRVRTEFKRYGSIIFDSTARNVLQKLPVYDQYAKAVKNLNRSERVALDMRAEDIHPTDLAEVFRGTPNEDVLTPKVADLMVNPSKRMLRAEPFARSLAAANARLLKSMGKLSTESEINRPGLAKKTASEILGRPVQTLHGDPYYLPHTHMAVDPMKGSSPFGSVGGGKAPPKRLGSTRRNVGTLFTQGKVGYGVNAAALEYLRRLKLIKFSEIHQALVDSSVRHTYDEIQAMPGGTLPKDFTFIRPDAAHHVPYTIRPEGSEPLKGGKPSPPSSTELAKMIPDPSDLRGTSLVERGLSTDDIRDVAPDVNGHYHIQPKQLVKAATGEFTRQGDILYLFNKYPVRIWRALLLGTRPAFLVNNLIGNSLMYAVKVGGTGALRDFIMAIAEHHGWRKAKQLLDDPVTPAPLRKQLTSELQLNLNRGGQLELTPGQGGTMTKSRTKMERATFGAQEVGDEPVPREPVAPSPDQSFYAKNYPEQMPQHGTILTQVPGQEGYGRTIPGKAGRAARGVTGAIPKLTAYAAEGTFRRGLIRNYIRRSPEFKAVYQALPKEIRTFENAAEKLHKGEGGYAFQRMISKEVDHSLGNYTRLSPFERNVMRSVFPFYSWYRAIVATTFHLAVDNPVRLHALFTLGQIGQQNMHALLTEQGLPTFLAGSIGAGRGPNGTQRILTTAGVNPWATIGQLVQGSSTDASQLGINPFFQGAFQEYARETQNGGKATVGGVIGHTLENTLTGLPTAQAIDPNGPSALYPNRGTGDFIDSREAAFLAWLGIPLKEYDPAVAAQYAAEGK